MRSHKSKKIGGLDARRHDDEARTRLCGDTDMDKMTAKPKASFVKITKPTCMPLLERREWFERRHCRRVLPKYFSRSLNACLLFQLIAISNNIQLCSWQYRPFDHLFLSVDGFYCSNAKDGFLGYGSRLANTDKFLNCWRSRNLNSKVIERSLTRTIISMQT